MCKLLSNKKKKKTILYYIKIINKELGTFFKIGVTTKTIEERFILPIRRGDIIEVLDIQEFNEEKYAYEKEQYILIKYNKYRCNTTKLFGKHEGGNTELFTSNILKNKKLKDIECNFLPKQLF